MTLLTSRSPLSLPRPLHLTPRWVFQLALVGSGLILLWGINGAVLTLGVILMATLAHARPTRHAVLRAVSLQLIGVAAVLGSLSVSVSALNCTDVLAMFAVMNVLAYRYNKD